MPYNYPMLLPLLQDLLQVYRLKPTNEWRAQFGLYMSTVPPYYVGPLKRALLRIGAGNIAATINEETYLSYSVLNYLKKLKSQAKVEYERTCAEVGARVQAKEAATAASYVKRINLYKNPYDVPRDQLLDHVCKLRSHFFRPSAYLQASESLHNQPVAQMGNYQEYLKRMPTPLREIESTPVRQHMFGNPFKIDKRIVIDKIDEADLDPIVGTFEDGAATPTRKPKRKPGPLPKGYHFIPTKNRLPFAPDEIYDESPVSSPLPSPSRSPTYDSDSEEINTTIFHTLPNPVTPIHQSGTSGSSSSPGLSMDVHLHETNSVEESLHFLEDDELPRERPLENGLSKNEEEGEEDQEMGTEDPDEPEPRRNSVDHYEAELSLQRRLEEEERIWKKNIEIRTELHKEIRRPIVRKWETKRKHSTIFIYFIFKVMNPVQKVTKY